MNDKKPDNDNTPRQDADVYYSINVYGIVAIYVVGKEYKKDEKIVSEEFKKIMKTKGVINSRLKATYFNFSDSEYAMGIINTFNSEPLLSYMSRYATNTIKVDSKHELRGITKEAKLLVTKKQRASILPRNITLDKEPLCKKVLDIYMNYSAS